MNESSFRELWNEKDEVINRDEDQIGINVDQPQNYCFYNFTRNPANYLKLNISENDFLENFHMDFNQHNLIYKKLENKKDSNAMPEVLEIIEEKQNLENSQKTQKSRKSRNTISNTNKHEDISDNFEDKISTQKFSTNKNNATPTLQENNSQIKSSNINNSQISIPENFEKSQQIINNSQLIKINHKLNLNLKMWRPSENSHNSINDFNYTQNFGNFQYIPQESENNNINYEDFNDIEDMNNNYKQYTDEDQNQNFPVVASNSSENSLHERFQVFSMKNRKSMKTKNEFITNISKENISNNIKPISRIENNFKNINQLPVPQTATKKVITKEYFSQQLKSLGNLQTQSVKNPDLVSIENKFGMNSQNLECPFYETFSEESLREEMKKYGMKPASTKFMVKHLKEIWSFINLKKLPQNLKLDLTKFMSAANDINEQVEINLPSKSCSKQQFMAKNSARQFNDAKKEKIISVIQDDKILWMKVLRFLKVDLKDVKEVLNKKGIIIENEILKEFLSELGVIFNQPR